MPNSFLYNNSALLSVKEAIEGDSLNEGDKVEYAEEDEKKGKVATNVEVIG
jgi:cold shock CspA family protein